MKDADVSPLEAVGLRYALYVTMKQVTYLSDKHFSDLVVNIEDFLANLATTFLDLLDTKHGINFWVAVIVRYPT